MRPRGILSRVAIAAAAVLVTTSVAAAAPPFWDGAVEAEDGAHDTHQHGATSGHLAASNEDVELVSKLKLKNAVPEKIADVGVLNGYAYLAAWGVVTCKYNGVHVVDINDPENPEEVAFIVSKEGSYPGEGVQALHISTASFNGDILVTNNEKCKDLAGFGGLNIYDITRPTAPTPLTEGFGDATVPGAGKKAANEIHSVFAWDAGDKAYAVIVDNEEIDDVDIIDISNPKKPVFIAEYDLAEEFPQIVQAAPSNLVEVFLHDMVVKEIGGRQIMLLSYWDAGYVALDVTDPLAPTYVGDTDFTDPDPELLESAGISAPPEGNGHQSELTRDNQYLIGADEDFAPYNLGARNVTDGTDIVASQGSDTTPLTPGATIEGPTVFVGRACIGDPAVPAGGAGVQIAVVERGLCTFTEKVTNVIAAGGYEAILIFNRTGSDACEGSLGMTVDGDIPTFGVAPRSQGFAIFNASYNEAACLADSPGATQAPITLGATGDTLRFSSSFDGWGYVHLFDYSSGKMAELDTFAIPEAHDPAYATGFGDLSVHEVATSHVRDDLAYLSYYSGGFRVLKIDGDELVEVGHYIDQNGNNFWGVQVFQSGGQEYVAASDRDSGLYIFRYTGTD